MVKFIPVNQMWNSLLSCDYVHKLAKDGQSMIAKYFVNANGCFVETPWFQFDKHTKAEIRQDFGTAICYKGYTDDPIVHCYANSFVAENYREDVFREEDEASMHHRVNGVEPSYANSPKELLDLELFTKLQNACIALIRARKALIFDIEKSISILSQVRDLYLAEGFVYSYTNNSMRACYRDLVSKVEKPNTKDPIALKPAECLTEQEKAILFLQENNDLIIFTDEDNHDYYVETYQKMICQLFSLGDVEDSGIAFFKDIFANEDDTYSDLIFIATQEDTNPEHAERNLKIVKSILPLNDTPQFLGV